MDIESKKNDNKISDSDTIENNAEKKNSIANISENERNDKNDKKRNSGGIIVFDTSIQITLAPTPSLSSLPYSPLPSSVALMGVRRFVYLRLCACVCMNLGVWVCVFLISCDTCLISVRYRNQIHQYFIVFNLKNSYFHLQRVPVILDEIGGSIGCSAVMAKTCELLVGRDEGVFSYSV